MDPNIVFDCEKNLSNRFALTVAAAARVRALARGSEPRIDAAGACRIELALREIAAGAFAADELFITSDPPAEAKRIAAAAPSTELCGDSASLRCRHIPRPATGEGSLMTQPNQRGE